jgi:hypothetical protein
MSVLNKKSRMVSFRLSPFEFTSAEADCERRGVRSVSTLARRALLGIMAQPDVDLKSDVPVDLKLERINNELSELRSQLDRLRLSVLPAPESAQTASPDMPG